VGASLLAIRPLQSAGFDTGCCRGQKTPPTEPPRLRPPVGRDPCGSELARDTAAAICRLRYKPLSGSEDPSHRTPAPAAGRARSLWERSSDRDAAAAIRRLRYRPLSESEDPSHRTPAPTAGRARSLWERPWPRRGRCRPTASIQAAVGVRGPLPQNPGSAPAAGPAHFFPCRALALARAVNRAHLLWERSSDRDAAAAIRRLSASEDPSHRIQTSVGAGAASAVSASPAPFPVLPARRG